MRIRALWIDHDGVGPLVDDDLAGQDPLRGHDAPPLGAVAVGHLGLASQLREPLRSGVKRSLALPPIALGRRNVLWHPFVGHFGFLEKAEFLPDHSVLDEVSEFLPDGVALAEAFVLLGVRDEVALDVGVKVGKLHLRV